MVAVTSVENLARYARTGAQEAFEEVVRETGPLVWTVAMRRLRDAQLAEEAAQNVFVALARKAGALSGRPGLLAWLHRAATLEAANLERSRHRRERRHRALAREASLHPPARDEEDSRAAGAWLDEALDSLSETDRTVLLARFYEGLGFRELGARMGRSEEAVKKRTQRALERLRQRLGAHRDTKPSAGALAVLLGAEWPASALPADTVSSLATAATATGVHTAAGSATGVALARISAILGSPHTLATAAVALAVLLVAVDWQYRRVAALETDVARAQEWLARSLPAARTGSGYGRDGRLIFANPAGEDTPPVPLTGESLIRAAFRRQQAGRYDQAGLYDPGYDWPALNDLWHHLSDEDCRRLLAEIDASSRSALRRRTAAALLLREVSLNREEWAMTEMTRLGTANEPKSTMRMWARKEPEAAWAWLSARMSAGDLRPLGASSLRDPERFVREGFARGLADRHFLRPENVVAFVLSQADSPWYQRLVNDVTGTCLENPANTTDEAMRFLSALEAPPAVFRAALSKNLWTLLGEHSAPPESTARLSAVLEAPAFPQTERQSFLREALTRGPYDYFNRAFVLMNECAAPSSRADDLAWLAVRVEELSPGEKLRAQPLRHEHAMGEAGALWDRAAEATAIALAERGKGELAVFHARKIMNEPRRNEVLSRLAHMAPTLSFQ